MIDQYQYVVQVPYHRYQRANMHVRKIRAIQFPLGNIILFENSECHIIPSKGYVCPEMSIL